MPDDLVDPWEKQTGEDGWPPPKKRRRDADEEEEDANPELYYEPPPPEEEWPDDPTFGGTFPAARPMPAGAFGSTMPPRVPMPPRGLAPPDDDSILAMGFGVGRLSARRPVRPPPAPPRRVVRPPKRPPRGLGEVVLGTRPKDSVMELGFGTRRRRSGQGRPPPRRRGFRLRL